MLYKYGKLTHDFWGILVLFSLVFYGAFSHDVTVAILVFQDNKMAAMLVYHGSHGGLMVSMLISRLSGPGLSPGQGHCVVSLGKIFYSHSASLHPGV